MKELTAIFLSALEALRKDPKSQIIIILLVVVAVSSVKIWRSDTRASNNFVHEQLATCEKERNQAILDRYKTLEDMYKVVQASLEKEKQMDRIVDSIIIKSLNVKLQHEQIKTHAK